MTEDQQRNDLRAKLQELDAMRERLDQQREAFEAWAKDLRLGRFPGGPKPWKGQYIADDTQLAWEAWQAACQWRDQAGEK